MTKAVANKQESAPAWVKNDGVGRGSEQVSSEDVVLPRIDVIQDLSPQHKEDEPEYIPGAKVGMLFNTLTGELYEKGLNVVPVYYEKQYLVWRDQKKGGGLQGVFSKDEQAEAEALADSDPDFDCTPTPNHIVVLCDDDGVPVGEAMIGMSKSKQKVNRAWNSLIRMQGGDRFSKMYRITSIKDQNNDGQKYMNLKVSVVGWPTQEAYEWAESLYEQIAAGKRNLTGTPVPPAGDGDDPDSY